VKAARDADRSRRCGCEAARFRWGLFVGRRRFDDCCGLCRDWPIGRQDIFDRFPKAFDERSYAGLPPCTETSIRSGWSSRRRSNFSKADLAHITNHFRPTARRFPPPCTLEMNARAVTVAPLGRRRRPSVRRIRAVSSVQLRKIRPASALVKRLIGRRPSGRKLPARRRRIDARAGWKSGLLSARRVFLRTRYLKWVSIFDDARLPELLSDEVGRAAGEPPMRADFLLDAYRRPPLADFTTTTTCTDI